LGVLEVGRWELIEELGVEELGVEELGVDNSQLPNSSTPKQRPTHKAQNLQAKQKFGFVLWKSSAGWVPRIGSLGVLEVGHWELIEELGVV
jgi:hypothetical protein